MNDLPAPLVSSEVDISKLDGFMLDTRKLLSSELVAISTPEEFKAAVLLWCRAWQQQPAASLPNDPRVLSSFAAVSAQRWSKIKDMALRGFVLCSDGRLYHRILAADANRAWEALRKRHDRTRAATDARKKGRDDQRHDPLDEHIDVGRYDQSVSDRDDQRHDNRDDRQSDCHDDHRGVGRDDQRYESPNHQRNEVPTVARDGTGRDGKEGTRVEKSSAGGQRASVREEAGRPAGVDRDLSDDPVETVFAAVAKAAENWFDVPERDRHSGDVTVIRGWLELAGSVGMADRDAVQVIAGTIDRQFKKLSKTTAGMPVSLKMVNDDVRGAISSGIVSPPNVAVASPPAEPERAPEPWCERFSLAQWASWIKPCTVEYDGGRAIITAPAPLTVDRLRGHHELDILACLQVDEVEFRVSKKVKPGKAAGQGGATIIPHPAVAGEVVR